ncbi:MAG: hypothetical protein ABIW80_15255 [Lapillicoccus sp.]
MRAGRCDSPPPLSGAARLLRVVTLSGTSLALAVAAHLVGGGPRPSGGLLALVGSLLVAVALLLTQQRCRLWMLLATVGIEQALLHLTFPASGTTPCVTGLAAAGHGPGSPLRECAPGGASMAMPMTSAPMVLAHIAATLVVVVLLWRGEAWLWRVIARLIGVPGAGPPLTGAPPVQWADAVTSRRLSVVRRPAAPRGPPPRSAPA